MNKKLNKTQPKISIFLPIYNKENYLKRSIQSIQNQTLKNIEIVAVNDGSTDNSLKILKKISKKDTRIKIINNDRNHGLLYARAMGILNCTGNYLMNLDPDDKYEGQYNLEMMHNMVEKSNFDLVIFLIKRISLNKTENKLAEIENELQINSTDYRITNKLIKKELFLKAYNNFSDEIHKYKWNYHEDNIWNKLVRYYSKKSGIYKKYIYIYRRNNDSLNMEKGNIIDIKNRIYRLKKLLNIYLNNNMFLNPYYYLIDIIKNCNSSNLKNFEIKKQIINLSLNWLNNNKKFTKLFDNIFNKIIDYKIIIFFDSYKTILRNFLMIFHFSKRIRQYNGKRRIIISININKYLQFKNIFNYIYYHDIIIGIGRVIFNKNFKLIINKYKKNKVIIFSNKKIYKKKI